MSRREKIGRAERINESFYRNVHEDENGLSRLEASRKKEAEDYIEAWSFFISDISNISKDTSDIINFPTSATEDFFGAVSFKKNKINIIQGDNGQGKSSLLRNITNGTIGNFFDVFSMHSKRYFMGSNNRSIAKAMDATNTNPYNSGLNDNKFDSSFSSLNTNITLYCDFSTSFYTNKGNDVFTSAIQSIDQHSDGERRIVGINDIFKYLKILNELTLDDGHGKMDFVVIMDEPDNGLSLNLKKQFKSRVEYYLNSLKNYFNITFFISSHSSIWSQNDYTDIINVDELKIEQGSKDTYNDAFL